MMQQGNSGIINIRLKKNKQKGTNGSVTAGVSRNKRSRDNMSLNINHKEGNINLFGTLSHGDAPNYRDLTLDRVTNDGTGKKTYFNQTTQMPQITHYNSYKVGVDLDLTSNHTIGAVISGYSTTEHDGNFNNTNIGAQRGTVEFFTIYRVNY